MQQKGDEEDKDRCFFNFKQWHVVAFIAFAILAGVFIISIILFLQFPKLIESNIRHSSMLVEDSLLLEKWQYPEYVIKTHISVFSVKNPDEVLNNSIPEVKLIGPYVFDKKIRRVVHSIGDGKVKYESYSTYFFNEENSCPECFLHNRIWVPNIIYQKFVEAASKPAMRAATAALFVQTPFLEVEVAELIFDGYADPFLDQVCAIPIVNFICESVLNLPERIGFFFKKNGSSSGVFEVNSGELDEGQSLGKILSWNGEKMVPKHWWSTPWATYINGTDGNLFPPYLSKDENITVFVPDLCRSINLTFDKTIDYSGIPALQFVVKASAFDFTLEQNVGFCNENGKQLFDDMPNDKCLPNGLLDVSRCQLGEPPVIVSFSNFLYTPNFVRRSIIGLREADPELDQILVIFEPRLGAVLEARRRFQINVPMWKGSDISDLKDFRNSVIPVLLIDEHARIDASSLRMIKEKLIYLEEAVKVATASASICSIIAVAVVVLYVIHRKSGSPVKNFIQKKIAKRASRVTVESGVPTVSK